MDFRTIALIFLQVIDALAKKYHSSSDESIENLLYFKDCQHKPKTTTTTTVKPVLLRAQRQPDCAFPKMCCSLTCGETDCSNAPYLNRPMETLQQNIQPMPRQGFVRQPQIVQPQNMPRGRKKKLKQPMRLPLQPPIGGRRFGGFTKDKIKSLINQDDDIRKILKDLVRVTIQKADLVEMINARNAANQQQVPNNSEHYDEDDDDELE